jgi:hypothetical protein
MTDIYLVPYHAVAALREDTRAWWRDQLSSDRDDYDEGEAPLHADVIAKSGNASVVCYPSVRERSAGRISRL